MVTGNGVWGVARALGALAVLLFIGGCTATSEVRNMDTGQVVGGATRPSVYVASPLGFAESTRTFYAQELLATIRQAGLDTIDPWVLTPQTLIDGVLSMPYGEQRRQAWRDLNLIIGKNNRDGIDRSSGIVAVLDGSDVDSGTASEIGYAFGVGKRIVGYRGDFRLSADNEGSIVNLQVEYWIRASGGEIVTRLKDLPDALRSAFIGR